MRKAMTKMSVKVVMVLLVFAAALTAVLAMTSFNLTKSGADLNLEVIKDILQPLPESLDSIYRESLDAPMETFFDSVGVVSFSFTTPEWPANDACVARARDDLARLAESSAYISKSFLYNSATDAYATSLPRFNAVADRNMDPYFRDVIYAYNSGSVDKQKLASSGHSSFLFALDGEIFVTKELTTRTGQPLSTLFVTLDVDHFTSALCDLFRLGQSYAVNVYDSRFGLLFSNMEEVPQVPLDVLMALSNTEDHIGGYQDQILLYYTSGQLPWRYVILVGQDFLNVRPETTERHWLIAAGVILLLITALCLFVWFRLRKPAVSILRSLKADQGEVRPGQDLIEVVRQRSEQMHNENDYLHEVVSHYSDDVLRSMFLGLIMGQQYDPADLKKTLTYTGSGFTRNDVYVMGVAKWPAEPAVPAEKRFAVLHAITETLAQFKKKYEAHTFAFHSDLSKIAITVSYPQNRTIAEGKVMTTALAEMLQERLRGFDLPIELHFGHLYHSLLDVGFSYSEADRTTEQGIGTVSPVILSQASEPEPDESREDLSRRAKQLIRLVYDDREEEARQLLKRVLDQEFSSGGYSEQCAAVKHMLSAVTEQIVTYDFIGHDQLTDVTPEIYGMIDRQAPAVALKAEAEKAVWQLCEDFSAALRRQRNPYITATLKYVSEHYSNPDLSLDEISEHLGVAPNYLSNLFSRSLGVKLFDYINDYRIKQSLKLLAETDRTVNDISLLSGFGTARNFIRVFKKHMDTTPGSYRKQITGVEA